MSPMLIASMFAACSPDVGATAPWAAGPPPVPLQAAADDVWNHDVFRDEVSRTYSPGDLDGDGFDEVVAATRGGRTGHVASVFWLHGGPDGMEERPAATWSDATMAQARLVDAGDLDGDGLGDLAYGESGPRVRVFLGAAGMGAEPAMLDAGADLIWGAVGPAGDADGDGYDDLPLFVAPADPDLGGRVVIWRGGPGGPASQPTWEILASHEHWPRFVGDVNGDGYDDLAIADWRFSDVVPRGGQVRLHLGGPSGPSVTPAWTWSGPWREGQMGLAVEGLGDVNGDGYADMAVSGAGHDGGPGPMDHTAVVVFHGGASGFADVPDWGRRVNPTLNSFMVGRGPGDVNGDGYHDLALTWGQWPRGEGAVFLGGPRGLSAGPWWTLGPDAADIGPAGDVDGDGLPDVALTMVHGASGHGWEGSVHIVRGAAVAADGDGDGALDVEDCADGDPSRRPGSEEQWNDGVDQDCDGGDSRFEVQVSGPFSSAATLQTGTWTHFTVLPVVPGATYHLYAGSAEQADAGPCAPAQPDACVDLRSARWQSSRLASAEPLTVDLPAWVPESPPVTRIYVQVVMISPTGLASLSSVQGADLAVP